MKANYYLFLDDIRDPKDGYLHGEGRKLIDASQIPAGCWDVVRSYEEFRHKIRAKGIPAAISFDNDLHSSHYQHFANASRSGGFFEWEFAQPKMGLHCLKYILEVCEKEKIDFPRFFIHTANPLAREIMEKMIHSEKIC